MKRILFLLAVFVLSAAVSGPMMAQDNPFVGTWKLNVAKSKFTGMPAPKEMTREIVAAGSGATYTFTGTDANGGAISYSFTSNYDGKDAAITGSGAPGGADAITIKRVSPSKAEGTLKKGGKEIAKVSAIVSKDGKTSTVTSTGKSADSKSMSSVSVYDKQ
ncbi:MAG: hypothetical protein WB630_22705 [Candidatus Acidiferrales bacterium]